MKEKNNWIVVLVIVVALFFVFGGWGSGMMGYGSWGHGGMMAWMYGYSPFSLITWIIMMTIWVLVIVALVLGIMWLIRQLQDQPNSNKIRNR